MIDNAIIYEQPLNEITRVCLRLEQLFNHIEHQATDHTLLGTRDVVIGILTILQLLDRPDLKTKLAKELGHQITLIGRLENTPEIDQNKLHTLLKQLEELSRSLINSNGKIGQSLREVELLNTLRLHLANPGGGCSFDVPIYHYWLQQPAKERQTTISSWLNEFNTIRNSIMLLLQLIREGSKVIEKTAEHGFYQELLDPQINIRLIRVALPAGIAAYPEISVGRHFLSVRFFIPSLQQRPTQYLEDIKFWISHCVS